MNWKLCLSLASVPLCSLPVYAQNEGNTFLFSGFGTGGVVRTNTDQAEFVRPNQVAGATRSANFGVDSMLGLQGVYKWDDALSATVQGLVRKNATDSFGGELAWAFAKYKVSNSLSLRLGRVGLPVYMISDYRNVGYANTMLRPPVETYAQVPIESVDGIDIIYQTSFGDWSLTSQVAYGSTKPKINKVTDSKFSNLSAINIVAETGPLSLRFGRVDTSIDLRAPSIDTLVTALNGLGMSAPANALSLDGKKGSFTSVGMTLDWNNFLVQAEYAKRKTSSLAIQDTSSWYSMFGYRYGEFYLM